MDLKMQASMDALSAGMQARVPTVLVGSPGVGKSATIHAMVEDTMPGYEFIVLSGAQMDPSDVMGYPHGEQVATREDGTPIMGTTYLMPWWQVRILVHKKVVLFLDEYSNATPAVRAAMLILLQDRMFPNGEKMPEETIVIGAMNPPEESPTGYDMDLPTGNRMLFIEWAPTANSWFEGMENNWGKKTSPQEEFWKKKIVQFLKSKNYLIHKMPDPGGLEIDKSPNKTMYNLDKNNHSQNFIWSTAWPSNRSWDNLSRALAACSGTPQAQDNLMKGIVGFQAALEFREFLQRTDMIDVEEVLADPSIVDWNTITLDNGHILFRALSNMVTEESAIAVLAVFRTAAIAGRRDLAAPYVKDTLAACMRNSFSKAAKDKIRPYAKETIQYYTTKSPKNE